LLIIHHLFIPSSKKKIRQLLILRFYVSPTSVVQRAQADARKLAPLSPVVSRQRKM
jgi:hypothetical protein